MDANKLEVLVDVGYEISPACGICQYAELKGEWGTCNYHEYEHLKHTGPERQLSINRYGSCKDFKPSNIEMRLGAYLEFFTDNTQ